MYTIQRRNCTHQTHWTQKKCVTSRTDERTKKTIQDFEFQVVVCVCLCEKDNKTRKKEKLLRKAKSRQTRYTCYKWMNQKLSHTCERDNNEPMSLRHISFYLYACQRRIANPSKITLQLCVLRHFSCRACTCVFGWASSSRRQARIFCVFFFRKEHEEKKTWCVIKRVQNLWCWWTLMNWLTSGPNEENRYTNHC